MCPTSWYCIKLQMHSAGNHHQRWWQLSLQLVLCIQQTRRLVICECWSFVSLLIIFTTYVLHFLIFIHIGLTWLCLLFLVFVYFYLRRLTSKVKIHKHKKRRQSHVRAIWFFFFPSWFNFPLREPSPYCGGEVCMSQWAWGLRCQRSEEHTSEL